MAISEASENYAGFYALRKKIQDADKKRRDDLRTLQNQCDHRGPYFEVSGTLDGVWRIRAIRMCMTCGFIEEHRGEDAEGGDNGYLILTARKASRIAKISRDELGEHCLSLPDLSHAEHSARSRHHTTVTYFKRKR